MFQLVIVESKVNWAKHQHYKFSADNGSEDFCSG